MSHSASIFPHGSEFDDFLFAPIAEDKNGMQLSVLSALARLDVDPWEEADKLAKLSRETATQILVSLIAALHDRLSARPDAESIAARLIALLPCRVAPDIRSRRPLPNAGAVNHSPAVSFWMFYVIVMVFVMVGQWLAARSAAPTTVVPTSASSSVFPQPSAPNSGP